MITLKPTKRQIHWAFIAALLLLMAVAAFIRLRNINRYSIWRDETWAIYLATGRGDVVFELPFQTVIASPPAVGFDGAPHWWHVWNTLDMVCHPPGYYLAIRWWVDLLGQSDLSVRGMSVLFGVASVAMIFDALAVMQGPWVGLAGAAILALTPIQIDLSQQMRP